MGACDAGRAAWLARGACVARRGGCCGHTTAVDGPALSWGNTLTHHSAEGLRGRVGPSHVPLCALLSLTPSSAHFMCGVRCGVVNRRARCGRHPQHNREGESKRCVDAAFVQHTSKGHPTCVPSQTNHPIIHTTVRSLMRTRFLRVCVRAATAVPSPVFLLLTLLFLRRACACCVLLRDAPRGALRGSATSTQVPPHKHTTPKAHTQYMLCASACVRPCLCAHACAWLQTCLISHP